MNLHPRIVILAVLAVLALAVIALYVLQEPTPEPVPPEPVSELPDFANYQDVNQKKQDFFEFLLPMIRQANQSEMTQRAFLKNLDQNAVSVQERAELYALAKRYRVKHQNLSANELIQRLTTKIDKVPASLVLAQAANESAWGTSRFARQGNNLFGIWCFTPGCGLKPKRRDSGAIHEVERFDTLQAGVNKYIRTINSHPAYTELRNVRARLRENEQSLSGFELAVGLEQYSERGDEYIAEIQAMINYNDLEIYD